jgi:hypothetical protein
VVEGKKCRAITGGLSGAVALSRLIRRQLPLPRESLRTGLFVSEQ